MSIDNIPISRVTSSGRLPVPPEVIDVALLYDVLHGGYFPEASQRIELLKQTYATIKPGGILSCYPRRIRRYRLTFRQLHREIPRVGFHLEAEAHRKLAHDDDLVRGRIFRCRKPVSASTATKGEIPRMKK